MLMNLSNVTSVGLALLALILTTHGGLVATACGAAEAPPVGYQLVWSDEFDGTALDMSKWSHRGLGPRRDALNVADAVSVGGGQLTITTYTSGGNHCTGMIGTEGKFERRFGYWEARIRFDGAPGMWSAFWIQTPTFGQPPNDPATAGTEIDVIEHRVSDQSGKDISGLAHHAVHIGGAKSQSHVTEDLKLGAGFHTFGVQWTETQYRFFVDGKMTWTATPVSKRPQYIILSSEVQDKSWAGAIPADGFGPLESSKTRMIVDYVRFYEPKPDREHSAVVKTKEKRSLNNCLQPAVQKGGVATDGQILWCPSVIHYANEKAEVQALFTACLPKEGPARIVVQPMDHYYPEN